ncbi:MAG: RNA-binding cell elongation regulator Jag/EloR [Anaerolineae bacterium]|nr:RNA-binding cell elongation regulator Jag/EloR [Anaerolineae bacterium]
MSDRSIEVQGSDVDTAVAAGLRQLGLTPDQVIVEVVDEGRRGVLGLGSRVATVRLTPLSPPAAEPAVPRKEEAAALPARQAQPLPAPDEDEDEDEDWADQEVEEEADGEAASVALEIVSELLDKMRFRNIEISVEQTEPDDKTGRVMTVVQVDGPDLAGLIGPRGETLNELQYVARLMAGHELKRRANFIVDVDGYRERRRVALTKLAERTAEKAVRRNRAVTLEAMSAYDRRIIHMALRDDERVYTSSVGEGAARRVRVYLKDR